MKIIDQRFTRNFDLLSCAVSFMLVCIGLLFIFSSTYQELQPFSFFFKKQLFGIILGFIIYIVCSCIDFRILLRWGYFAYLVVVGLLIFTIIKGSIGMGAQRWISVGLFKFQASELAKLLFPAFAIYYFYTEKNNAQTRSARSFIPLILSLAGSFLLILKQPDLGTALIVLFSGTTLFWHLGLDKRFFLFSIILIGITTPISWHILKPYQKKRILVFLGGGESKKERYQIEQSKIAIGSGGIAGKGFLQGTQNKLKFLPECRTDFIFSVIAEELGLLGGLFILILYAILFTRMLMLACAIKNNLVQALAVGIIIHIIFSTLINMCMVIGLLPIVGIPLPLISYGISNLWVTLASLGWFNGIIMRQFYIEN